MNQELQKYISPVAVPTTTVQKTSRALVISGVSVIILAVASAVVGNPQLFSWKSGVLVTIANALLVFVPNVLSNKTPNI